MVEDSRFVILPHKRILPLLLQSTQAVESARRQAAMANRWRLIRSYAASQSEWWQRQCRGSCSNALITMDEDLMNRNMWVAVRGNHPMAAPVRSAYADTSVLFGGRQCP
jgi:hypothetical protein